VAGVKPYFEKNGIVIYHGDCHDIMPQLGPVHSLITDPPFGIDFGHATWPDDPECYGTLIQWLVDAATKVVPLGWCFVFQAMPNVGRFHEWFPEGWRIFAACKNFAQIRPNGIWHSWDPVVFWANNQKPGRIGKVCRDYFVGNVAGAFGERVNHPCPRPLDTMEYIVSISVPEHGTVLDPFMGSGTTLVAAKILGRSAIGIEIEERYCEIAVERLSQTTVSLFV
jgi:site-specific DNA-methyltransferase (adenine-specific)